MVAVAISGCTSNPSARWYHAAPREETTTVAGVHSETRLVSLRNDRGYTVTVYAGPRVRNLDQLALGDRVVATYQPAIATDLRGPDQAAPATSPAEPWVATVQARIDGIDDVFQTLTFRGDDGLVRIVNVEDPHLRAAMRDFKQGGVVTVTYSEAVANEIRPVVDP